jgi:hypothetical protein
MQSPSKSVWFIVIGFLCVPWVFGVAEAISNTKVAFVGEPINFWFLLFSLLFPRITLFVAWLNNAVPKNDFPFWGDCLMTLFVPRILIVIYIGFNLGITNPWFIVHVIFCVLAYYQYGFKKGYKSKD